jgi:DNA-binding SARP family transcriptional activator
MGDCRVEEVPPCRLHLLDRLELTIGSCRPAVPAHADRLLALLAVRGKPITRATAAQILWPEVPDSQASAKLRSVLWRTADYRQHVIEFTNGTLSLAESVWVDYHESTHVAERLVDRSATMDRGELAKAMRADLCSDLLPQSTEEEWLAPDQRRFRQLRLHALEALCERLIDVDWYGAAINVGLCAVSADPLRESAHYSLIRAYLAEGNRPDALQQFDCYRQMLNDELNLQPSPKLRELVIAAIDPSAMRGILADGEVDRGRARRVNGARWAPSR